MGFLFSKKEKEPPSKRRDDPLSETDKAKLQLKQQRVRLRKYRDKCEKVIAREVAAAKDLLKKKQKKKALLLLKKKKLQEKLLDKTQGQLLNIETLLNEISSAEMNAEVMKAMEQ